MTTRSIPYYFHFGITQGMHMYGQWTLSAITSQHKNGGDSGGTLYRVVLGEMVFSYNNVYILQQGGM